MKAIWKVITLLTRTKNHVYNRLYNIFQYIQNALIKITLTSLRKCIVPFCCETFSFKYHYSVLLFWNIWNTRNTHLQIKLRLFVICNKFHHGCWFFFQIYWFDLILNKTLSLAIYDSMKFGELHFDRVPRGTIKSSNNVRGET